MIPTVKNTRWFRLQLLLTRHNDKGVKRQIRRDIAKAKRNISNLRDRLLLLLTRDIYLIVCVPFLMYTISHDNYYQYLLISTISY